MTATAKATEAVAEVAEEVSDQALNVAEVARQAPGRGLGLAVGAFLVGTGVGGGVAFLLTRRKLETKYAKISDNEIAEMREHYQAKVRAAEATAAKRPMEEIVKEQGYAAPEPDISARPPMAVQPPAAVVEEEGAKATDPPKAIPKPPVPVDRPAPEVRNIFRDRQKAEEAAAEQMPEWDYHEELRHRSPETPYVIHYDEREEMDYQVVTLTYYEQDDVVCDERDTVIDENEREKLLGEKNLNRFGHGSNDPSVVYIRNDQLEIVYEVVKSPNSYAEEVHGFTHEGYYRGNLERMRARERHAREED
jgi:hypothetical protein